MSRVSPGAASLALCVALAAAGTPVRAQQQIAVGQAVSGALTVSSPLWSDGARYNSYVFYGTAGQYVSIAMNSSEFDSYLILLGPAGTEIARNDDGGGGLNSLIQQSLPYTGQYRIIAKAYTSDRYGNYMLMLQGSSGAVGLTPTPMPMTPTAMVTSPNQINLTGNIGANQQVMGNLTGMDQRLDNKPVQLWGFQCAAGQTFQMDILSSWDNYAIVYDPVGIPVARDDDTGEGLNARIIYTCQVAGVYRLAVTTYSTGTTPGAYTLQVQSAGAPMAMAQPVPMAQPMPIAQPAPMAQPAPQAIPMAGNTMPAAAPTTMAITGSIPAPGQIGQINFGENHQGRLETGDQQMNDGTWADVWQFSAQAGQRVRIELRSEEFDTYLQLLDASGSRLAEDDDSLGNLDSVIEYTLPRAGIYQIVVNNFSEERRAGIYTLSLMAR